MTATDIRDVLQTIGHDVDVPPVDRLAFDGRVRGARRRRTAVRAAGLAGTVAVIGVLSAGLAGWQPWHGDAPIARDPNLQEDFPFDGSQVILALEGKLVVSAPDDLGELRGTGVLAKQILQSSGPSTTILLGDGRVYYRLIDGDGQLRNPPNTTSDGPVLAAWESHDGGLLAYVDPDGKTLVRPAGYDEPTIVTGPESPTVAAIDSIGDGGVIFAWASDRRLSVIGPDGTRSDAEAAFPITDIDIAGTTIAVETLDGVETHELDGSLRWGSLGGAVGALSADGLRYATGSTRADMDAGMSRGLWLVNTTQGTMEDVTLPGDAPVTDVWWQDSERFLVVTGDRTRTLYDCALATASCTEALVDDTGTLQLPQD